MSPPVCFERISLEPRRGSLTRTRLSFEPKPRSRERMTRLLEHPRPWLEHEPGGSTIRTTTCCRTPRPVALPLVAVAHKSAMQAGSTITASGNHSPATAHRASEEAVRPRAHVRTRPEG